MKRATCLKNIMYINMVINNCKFLALLILPWLQNIWFNLQATKLFIATSATKGLVTTLLRFNIIFKILYRVIQRLIQRCLLRKMVYLNVKCVNATRTYEFYLIGNITLSRVIIYVASVN